MPKMVEVTPQHRTERILDGAVNNTMKGSISQTPEETFYCTLSSLCLLGCYIGILWVCTDLQWWVAKLSGIICLGLASATLSEMSDRRSQDYHGENEYLSPLGSVIVDVVFLTYQYPVVVATSIRGLTWVGYLIIAVAALVVTTLIMIGSGRSTTGSILAICTGGMSLAALIMAIVKECPQKAPAVESPPTEDPCCEGTCDH